MSSRTRGVRKAGFTLVELMVVVIIIGILAAVATPIYSSQTRRARTSEAITALGAVRQAERVYYTEHNVFLAVAANNVQNDPSATNPGLGLDYSKNTYFDDHCVTVALDGTYQFVAACDGGAAGNAAPRAADVSAYQVETRGDGTVRCSYNSGSSWTAWE
jgi:prepilin-type N-terminal cleavage/methylation domain-containing protein